MKAGGYRTHYTGKWDAGMATPQHTPYGRGFETSGWAIGWLAGDVCCEDLRGSKKMGLGLQGKHVWFWELDDIFLTQIQWWLSWVMFVFSWRKWRRIPGDQRTLGWVAHRPRFDVLPARQWHVEQEDGNSGNGRNHHLPQCVPWLDDGEWHLPWAIQRTYRGGFFVGIFLLRIQVVDISETQPRGTMKDPQTYSCWDILEWLWAIAHLELLKIGSLFSPKVRWATWWQKETCQNLQ